MTESASRAAGEVPEGDPAPRAFDALVLTGGGINAAAFHFAVLACLEDSVGGFDAGAFPVYLGSSAGATVAALVGGGLPVRRLHRSVVDGDGYFPVRREHFFPGSRSAFLRPLLALASRTAAEALRSLRRTPRPRREPPPLAPGLFSMEPYEEFLGRYMESRGLPLRFEGLRRRLLVPGFDLDAARRVVFGRAPWRNLSIPRAVAASSAIPLLFRPVEVDGRWIVDGDTGGNNHLDVLLAEGLRRFLVVNAVVPLVSTLSASLRDLGMLAVLSQAMRTQNSYRFSAALHRQLAAFPDMQVTLITPPPGDARMLTINSMSLATAPAVAAHAYETTRQRLRAGGWDAFDARGGASGSGQEEDLEHRPGAAPAA